MPYSASAAVKIGNLSRANKSEAYQQVNDLRYQVEMANQLASQPVTYELPIEVTNQELAEQIKSGDAQASVSVEQLDKCSKIYPNGQFMWSKPTAGRGAGGATTCVAVVEMRAAQAGPNGEDLVVARANLAAGDVLNCNISAFPQSGYLPDAANVEFPADAEPTREEVVAVMNEEQKQHAGLKILAGGLVAAIAGNVVGDNEPGKDSLLGTGKSKMKSAAIGALGGAGLMAASTYGGKVAGDMIMSAGVNAAAGALVGNMSGKGDGVLRVEKCVIDGNETTCLYGRVRKEGDPVLCNDAGKPEGCFDELYVNKNDPQRFLAVKKGEYDSPDKFEYKSNLMSLGFHVKPNNDSSQLVYNKCGNKGNENCSYEEAAAKLFDGFEVDNYAFCYKEENNVYSMKKWSGADCVAGDEAGPWIKLGAGNYEGERANVMMVGVPDKKFGWKKSDFDKEYDELVSKHIIVGRDSSGGKQYIGMDVVNPDGFLDKKFKFEPLTVDASDGSLIDFDNKARTKSTLVGAGAGAGLGAFTAYQGAQSEIEERLYTAQREYKDSLTKVYCITGNRLLSMYNDVVQIPNMPQ